MFAAINEVKWLYILNDFINGKLTSYFILCAIAFILVDLSASSA